MGRPYVICHMTMSIDGKVTGDFLSLPEYEDGIEEYYRLNREFEADAFACGRVTMEGSFTEGWYPDLKEFEGAKVGREDFVASDDASLYAVSFDRRGRLGWKTSEIEDDDPGYGGAHIIEVLCTDTKDEYLAYLRKIGVSYIFAGEADLDLELALAKLRKLFGIRLLLLEGGSGINGAFQREGLVDELSLVQLPVIAGADGKPLFGDSVLRGYGFIATELLGGGAQWLRFKKL